MKILYMVYFDIEKTCNIGISKKIKSQVKSFNQLGHHCDLISVTSTGVILSTKQGSKEIKYSKFSKNYRRSFAKIIKSMIDSYDTFYIRYPGSIDPSTYNLFREMNNKNLILEIPTYPFSGEINEYMNELKKQKRFTKYFFKKILYFIDSLLTKRMKKYVDLIVTYMPSDDIFNIKTISIDNGVDSESYPVCTNRIVDNKSITLLGVANISIWHGYDRIIEGIYNYNKLAISKDRKIYFEIVGDGDYLKKLKDQVNLLDLNEYVHFLGPKYYQELINCYNSADIAVGSLGLHRIGLNIGSTIKIKEFCSLGIPFLYSYTERELDEKFPFALKLNANDRAIDMKQVLYFYDEFYSQNVIAQKHQMHKFAKENFSWNSQLNRVIKGLDRHE